MTETGGRSTAAALILLLALVFALLVALIVPAFISWTENGRSIRADRERIASVNTAQTSFARVKNASDRWTLFARSPDAGFLDATNAVEAQTAAQARIETALATRNGSLDSAAFEAGESKRGQVETVVMTITATLPKTALAPLLTDLEDTRPYTFISEFRIMERDDDRVRLTFKGQMEWLREAGL